MSAQAITPISGSSTSKDSSVQGDYQVQQLEYQIKDWSTCPTTPPAMKKQIVGKLQLQLDSVEKTLENHENTVQAQKQANDPKSGPQTAGSNTQGGSASSSGYKFPFRVDTYA